jgi:2-(3-amino-3-carboxypropyl)histidine synthase
MTLRIDLQKIEAIIESCKPSRVVFNTPDGLLKITMDAAKKIEKSHPGIQTILVADPTYGSCDTVDSDARALGAEVAFHIGHNTSIQKLGKISYNIDVWDDVSFSEVVEKAARFFNSFGFRRIGLVTFAQYLQSLDETSKIFGKFGIETRIGKGLGQLHDGQVFGCEFYPAFSIKDSVDAMALLGNSVFHAIGVCLSTGRPTYMLDPYSNEVRNVQDLADERLKRAILSVYKAREAEHFGVIICLKEGQMMPDQSIRIKKDLESFGKIVDLLAMREITPERLDTFTGIQAFVQTGCPRVSIDGYTFSKPVLSVPQAMALIRVLSGQELEPDLLIRKHWL